MLDERAIDGLFRYAVRLTGGDRASAEDLVQETCLAYIAHVRERDDAELSAGWLTVVLRRRFLDSIRHTQREKERISRAEAANRAPAVDWTATADNVALNALSHLAADQRAALVFRYVDDLPVREVAELLGRSVTATESLLARARRELARHLEEVQHG